jgi:hypothetical protein
VNTTGFDMHSSVKTLTAAGMPEPQAEAVTALLKLSRDTDLSALATKADLTEAKADLLRDIAEVRADLAQTNADLRRDLAETKADILNWMVGMVGGAVVINAATVIGAMLALVLIVGH